MDSCLVIEIRLYDIFETGLNSQDSKPKDEKKNSEIFKKLEPLKKIKIFLYLNEFIRVYSGTKSFFSFSFSN